MAEVMRMPEVLAGATEAIIQTWLVDEGATVSADQLVAEIETDKAIVELTAESAGTIGRLLVPEGNSVSVGSPIFVLLADGEGQDDIGPALDAAGVATAGAAPAGTPAATPTEPDPEPDPEPEPEPDPEPEPEPGRARDAGPRLSGATVSEPARETGRPEAAPPGGSPRDRDGSRRLFASPLVRKLAAQAGVELSDVRGTGPRERITRRDFDRHMAERDQAQRASAAEAPAVEDDAPRPAAPPAPRAAPAAPPAASTTFEDVPIDRMRRTIARRLTESKSTVPHFYLVADCRVDALLQLRRTVNEQASRKISVNDFVLKAVAGALVDVPVANAIWNDDSIRRFSSVDISVAVATDGGLTTPVLRGVERLSLGEISATVADMAGRAREGRLKQHELEGGSFSVSNLGMYGTGQFSAILNPPQSGILAVGAARAVPVVGPDGDLTVGQVMTVTLSADHRVLDGAVAAEWLAAFQRRLESPLSILI